MANDSHEHALREARVKIDLGISDTPQRAEEPFQHYQTRKAEYDFLKEQKESQ
jgi:hypothetical protein